MKRHSDHRAWLARLRADKLARRAREAQQLAQAKLPRSSNPVDSRRLLAILAVNSKWVDVTVAPGHTCKAEFCTIPPRSIETVFSLLDAITEELPEPRKRSRR